MKNWYCLGFAASVLLSNSFAIADNVAKVNEVAPNLACSASKYKYYVSYEAIMEDGSFTFNYQYVCSNIKADTQNGMEDIIQAVKNSEVKMKGKKIYITIQAVIPLVR